jgi:arylsulfatase A-like enzyme
MSAGETGDTTGDTGSAADTAPLVFSGDVPTNLLFISIDTTRRDQIGTFGVEQSTPNWDAILSESMVLMDHRSCSSWTLPSMACATLGVLPIEDGWWPAGLADSDYDTDAVVPDGPEHLPTLAATLVTKGMLTGLVSGNGLFAAATGNVSSGYGREEIYPGGKADLIAARTLAMVRTFMSVGQPWLQHAHFMDPHSPYDAPTALVSLELAKLDTTLPWDFRVVEQLDAAVMAYPSASADTQEVIRSHLVAAYRAQLRYFDRVLGGLWADLEAMGALEDTLVVFWSDHGEQLGEHGEIGHGVSLDSQENRAIAAFWAANLEPGEWTEPTFHQDIAPTLYDLLALTPNHTPTGHVLGSAPKDRVGVTFNLIGGVRPEFGILSNESMLYYKLSGDRFFYDLAADPEGDNDIYDPTDARVVALWAEMHNQVRGLQSQFPFFVATDLGP